MIDFKLNLTTEEHNFKELFESTNGSEIGKIPTSKEVTGIEIRLSNVLIIDNKTPKIWPFPGYSDIYFINLVLSDINPEPLAIDLKGFQKVDDGDTLNIDRTLFLYQQSDLSLKVPTQVHIMTSLVKSKSGLREVGDVLSKIKNDNNYKDLINSMTSIITNVSQLSNVSNLIFNIANIVGTYLGEVDDKPLLTWFQSFTEINGDWDIAGKTDKKAENRYASMKLTCIVRDNSR